MKMAIGRQQKILRNVVICCSIPMLLLSVTTPIQAGLPDEETYEYLLKRYSIFLEAMRDGCSRYANPRHVVKKGSTRSLQVLIVRGERGGTLCNGVFRFESLRVDCQTNLVAYDDYIASPANWNESKPYKNPELARRVCSLPVKV